jgi:FkbM family methyltransferase
MAFVTYAQNFEDVMLWRALGHVERGFYIDVGANDPTALSVTRAFYDRGWSGINLEPVPAHFAALVRERPRDLNLCLCAGVAAGEIQFFDVVDTELATSSESIAAMHRMAGREVKAMTAAVLPLAAICAEHVHGEIHFLKIDVEGAEQEVLQGMDFQRWRPWILVIEATLPNTQQATYAGWEPLVLAAGYEFIYFDGLSRFYIAREHPELKAAFSTPANVHDHIHFHTHLAQLAESARQLRAMEDKATILERKVAAMQASFSWQCTVPLRWLRRWWGRLGKRGS